MAAIHTLTSFLDSIASVTVAAWFFRITVLTALACMYLALARRTQPALRHAVAVGSLIAIVLLPAASGLLPALNVPVLRAGLPGDSPAAINLVVSSETTPAKFTVNPSHAPDAMRIAATSRPQTITTPGLVARGLSSAREAFLSKRNWIRFAMVMWLLVGTGLLARLALASARVFQVARRATPVNDEFLRVEVERACRALGVTRWIDVAVSSEIAVPMVIGAATPRIVLPVAVQQWSRERMGVVLLHEIAHIRRRDCLSMLFAQIVGSVLWFHPAVIELSRHVRRESERACDDLVLATGVRGSDYAEHLVSIARLSARHDSLPGAALAFAARSTLEQRVASILVARPRVLHPRVIGAVTAAAVALSAAIAAVHPIHAAPAPAIAVEPAYSYTFGDVNTQPHRNTYKVEIPVGAAAAVTPKTPPTSYNYVLNAEKLEKLEKRTEKQVRNRFETRWQSGTRLAGTNEDESDGESWYDRAHSYYQRRSWDKAGRAYENAARFGYEPGTAFYNAGCSYALAGQSDAAIKMLQNALENGFEDPAMYASDDDLNSLRADARFKKLIDQAMRSEQGQENLREAQRQYEQLASGGSVDEGKWGSVGVDLMRAGEYDRAAAAFDNEYKISQDNDALYNKACARSLQGRTSEALDILQQSIEAGPVDVGHMRSDPDLAGLHNDTRFDELVDLAHDLNLSDSWQNDLAIWKGNEQERWKSVLPHFESVASEHPKTGRAWFNLGFVQLMADQPQNGRDSFQKAFELGFRNPTTLYNLACASARAGDADAAFTYLAKAQEAGFDVGSRAPGDGDLESLKTDPRWKELEQRWQAEEEQKYREKHKNKYD